MAIDPVDEAANRRLADDPAKGAMFRHPNGARRVTGVRMVVPSAADLPPAARYLSDAGVAAFETGTAWRIELVLDGGQRRKTADLRPVLPLVLKY